MLSQQSLNVMLEAAPFGMLLIDENVQVQRYNKQMLNILPWLKESDMGQSPGMCLLCAKITGLDEKVIISLTLCWQLGLRKITEFPITITGCSFKLH